MSANIRRLKEQIEKLAAFTSTPGQGCTRYSFTEEYKNASCYLADLMKEAGMEVSTNPIGVLIGRIPGKNPDAPCLLISSHLDSPENGGKFDGAAGILAGIEIARMMKEENLIPAMPIEVAAFPEVEGSRFGASLLGSRSITGHLEPSELTHHKTEDGLSLYEVLKEYGTDPASYTEGNYQPDPIGYSFELHIEQGPVLNSAHYDMGVVDAIAGVHVVRITVRGRNDHAGTTPMTQRADSFLIAARAAIAVNDAALSLADGTVATVGCVSVKPDEYNIIPSETTFTVDVRSRSDKSRAKVLKVLSRFLDSTCLKDRGLSYKMEEVIHHPSVMMDDSMRRLLLDAARKLRFSAMSNITSGTYHDSVMMSQCCPTAMLFIPCRSGRTHCPEESTDYSDLKNGIDVLYEAVKTLAGEQ